MTSISVTGELRRDLRRGEHVDPKSGLTPLSEPAKVWLASKKVRKASTQNFYLDLWEAQFQPRWGSRPVRSIGEADAILWVADLIDDELSCGRILQRIRALRAIMGIAVSQKMIQLNPITELVQAPSLEPPDPVALTNAEVVALIAATEDSELKAIIAILAWCGLRVGELAALKVESVIVDPNTGRTTLRVKENLVELSRARAADRVRPDMTDEEKVEARYAKLKEGTPKGNKYRDVPVAGQALPYLVAQTKGKRRGATVFDDDIHRDRPLRASRVRDRLQRLNPAGGLLDGFCTKYLRDTCASLLISANASVKTVAKIMGHVDAVMTLNRYAAWFPTDVEAAAVAMEQKFLTDISFPEQD